MRISIIFSPECYRISFSYNLCHCAIAQFIALHRLAKQVQLKVSSQVSKYKIIFADQEWIANPVACDLFHSMDSK